MGRFLLRRLGITIAVIFGAITLSFFLLKLIPGDPAEAVAGPQAAREDIELIREKLGLNRPVHEQYLLYLKRIAQGDLGDSLRTTRPVAVELAEYLPNTGKLAVCSMIVAILVGVPLGVLSAYRRGSLADVATMIVSLLGISMPSFWLGLLLILLFSVKFKLLPFFGIQGPTSYILPSLTLGLGVAGNLARLTRASMLEVLRQDYVRTARAKGLSERVVIFRHALRCAAIPTVTIIGLQLGALLGGAVVTESVFSWPGLGRLVVGAIGNRDLPVVQGGILVFAVTFVVLNLLVDLAYHALDPRIRL